MDAQFLPAVTAIRNSETRTFVSLIQDNPQLATTRSSDSHPTLMQCLALEGYALSMGALKAMAQALVQAGSPLHEPLIATGSSGNTVVAEVLLDQGASLNGSPEILRGWTVLEEALYWGESRMVALLLQRGATQHNLRIAAALGNLETMRRFFDASGELENPAAHAINWPFGTFPEEHQSQEPLDIFDNALAYAAMAGHQEAVEFLLQQGAVINAWPRGFHYRGTPLHWTAARGNRQMCEFLLDHGANPALLDMSEKQTAAQWARAGKNAALAEYLDSRSATEST